MEPLWPSLFGQDLIWLFSFYSYRWESQALLVWGWAYQVWESEPPWTWASPRLLLKWCRKYISHCFSGLAGTSEGIQGNTSLSPRGFLDPDKRSSGFYLHTFCKRELTIYQGIFSTSVGSDCWKSFAYTEICLPVTIYHYNLHFHHPHSHLEHERLRTSSELHIWSPLCSAPA